VLADWDEQGHYVAVDTDGIHTRHVVG
jgi:hypothetical protein